MVPEGELLQMHDRSIVDGNIAHVFSDWGRPGLDEWYRMKIRIS